MATYAKPPRQTWFNRQWPGGAKPGGTSLQNMVAERGGYKAAKNAMWAQQALAEQARNQQNTGGGGGGGGGFGGGGGGAAPPAVTQAMIDAMAQAYGGAQGQQLTYQNMPAFHGQALGAYQPLAPFRPAAFNAAPYQQQQRQVNQALSADTRNFATNQAATTQAVQGAYSNPYANAQVTAGAPTPTVGAGLMGTAGAAAAPDVANQMNAENAQNQGTFQDLMRVLGATQQASQGSRMAQVAMDANYGRQQLGAQALGMRAGIANNQAMAAQQWNQGQTQAAQQWAQQGQLSRQQWYQQQQERAYQNNLMQQQWAQQNAQGQQAVNQANWQNQNQNVQSRLQPILDLIGQSAGIGGLNFAGLIQALQGGRAA